MTVMDILRTAVFALRGNWMRSALTSLGVIIGIAAVIVMVSVGQGTQQEIDKMVSGLGSQRLDISPGAGRGPGGGGVRSEVRLRVSGTTDARSPRKPSAALRCSHESVPQVHMARSRPWRWKSATCSPPMSRVTRRMPASA